MDLRVRSLRRAEKVIDLSRTEWEMLELLMRHADQVLPAQNILDYIWSYDAAVKPELVDVYISYLRKKIEINGYVDPIQTIRGVGYLLETKNANNLRIKLTLLYLAVAILLVFLLGSTTYGVLYYYFQNSSDLALRTKMAIVLILSVSLCRRHFHTQNGIGLGRQAIQSFH